MDQAEFCWCICLAARNLGIRIQKSPDAYVWVDPQTRVTIQISRGDDAPNDHLERACKELVEYFTRRPSRKQ